MLITEDKEIDIFVASRIGSLKHVKYHTESTKNNKKCVENLVEIKSLQKDDTFTCMEWGNAQQTEILLGKKNQQIQVYNTLEGFTKQYTADFAPGHIVGIGRCKRRLVAAVSSGVVKVWSRKAETLVQAGGKLDRMRVCGEDNTLFATGGEENDLKIWRVGEPTPLFAAKNLPHDWLQLRLPVWPGDLCFVPGGEGRLAAACSRHGYVRLYDTRAQRRPVCNVDFTMAATCLCPGFEDRQVLVGFGRGQLHQVDLRKARPDKGYKGSAGAITSVATAGEQRLVVSTSLDRQLRVHDHGTKELVFKQYLTSKLSCVLVQTEGSTPLHGGVKEEDGEGVREEGAVGEEDEMDQIFDNMETVGVKQKKEITEETPAKKIKPSVEGSTTEVGGDEEAIVQLLRSTEKQKRRLEKKKREKKAKSLYHNA